MPSNVKRLLFAPSGVSAEICLARLKGPGDGRHLFKIQAIKWAAGCGCGVYGYADADADGHADLPAKCRVPCNCRTKVNGRRGGTGRAESRKDKGWEDGKEEGRIKWIWFTFLKPNKRLSIKSKAGAAAAHDSPSAILHRCLLLTLAVAVPLTAFVGIGLWQNTRKTTANTWRAFIRCHLTCPQLASSPAPAPLLFDHPQPPFAQSAHTPCCLVSLLSLHFEPVVVHWDKFDITKYTQINRSIFWLLSF